MPHQDAEIKELKAKLRVLEELFASGWMTEEARDSKNAEMKAIMERLTELGVDPLKEDSTPPPHNG